MREYHVNMRPILLNYVGSNTSKYRGNIGVRIDATTKTLMLISQHKSSYHQFIFLKNHWKGPTRMSFILPKIGGE